MDKCYQALLNVFYHLSCYVPNEKYIETIGNNRIDSKYRFLWRYLNETIVTWLLVTFLDKLPKTRHFIANVNYVNDSTFQFVYENYNQDNINGNNNKNKNKIGEAKHSFHTDFGGKSFIEFFLEFKYRLFVEYNFHF